MERDAEFMERAVKLAARGLGHTRPNPAVGAVIVKGGKIIGEGWHKKAGGDHADYVGKEQGRVVLTGNAWAVKENNTMKSNKLTLYLDPEGRAKVK